MEPLSVELLPDLLRQYRGLQRFYMTNQVRLTRQIFRRQIDQPWETCRIAAAIRLRSAQNNLREYFILHAITFLTAVDMLPDLERDKCYRRMRNAARVFVQIESNNIRRDYEIDEVERALQRESSQLLTQLRQRFREY